MGCLFFLLLGHVTCFFGLGTFAFGDSEGFRLECFCLVCPTTGACW